MPGTYAFHSPQMDPHRAELTELLAGLTPTEPTVPLLRTSGITPDGTEPALDSRLVGP